MMSKGAVTFAYIKAFSNGLHATWTKPGWSELKVIKKNNDLIAVIGSYTNTGCFWNFPFWSIDINECSFSPSVCDVNANCQNNAGSYTCSCNAGFIGDGNTCEQGMSVLLSWHITRPAEAIFYYTVYLLAKNKEEEEVCFRLRRLFK